jgi:NAD(P)H-dependent FMN reductase
MMKKIMAFSGSNSSKSINRALLRHAAGLIEQHEVTMVDLRDFDVPVFSEDLEEATGIPSSIQKLRAVFDRHDAFMIASPEHNSMMPAFFKNIMDWISRLDGKIFQEKPVLLMSASPGGRGGQTNLANMQRIFPHWGASAVFGDFHLGRFYEVYDLPRAEFIDSEKEALLEKEVRAFEQFLRNV